jgi:hypothetical protein
VLIDILFALSEAHFLELASSVGNPIKHWSESRFWASAFGQSEGWAEIPWAKNKKSAYF